VRILIGLRAGKAAGAKRETEMKKKRDDALELDDKYGLTHDDIVRAGGKWNDEMCVYEFADGSFGGFSDIAGNASEQTVTGEPIFHFVGHPADENPYLD
jgi:hypothetical protein